MCLAASAPRYVCEIYQCAYMYASADPFTSMHSPLYAYIICPSHLGGHVHSFQVLVIMNVLS